ncbi:putative dehydrogenase [Nakamurella sp. UYEF19]|uniref:Gfo/Idh/MocA family protein n=1 Tax=Nakamurella sp. UYEF19 TaxID=1756392 RepID=UPI0033925F87
MVEVSAGVGPVVGWGILGTANIAARAFLPALRGAGGRAVVVGSRSDVRGAEWAAQHQVERSSSYDAVLGDPEVQAVYLALPNDQHTQWAAAALAAGKVVLCEKPMALDGAQAQRLLAAVPVGGLLWESFVFPFHPQTALISGLIADGRIGDLSEIISEFHFQVGSSANIRLDVARGGGALYDVGCYPLRLGRLLFGAEPVRASGNAVFDGVDRDMAAVVDFPVGRLILSAGLHRPASTFTRIIGTAGELRVSNPFHPRGFDTVELWADGVQEDSWPAAAGSAFQHAITHIQSVITGSVAPQHLATGDALAQALAMDLVRASITDRLSS